MPRTILALLILLVASASPGCAESIRGALTSLCDPAKIATITSERGANPRVRKITYWLEMARLDGRDPAAEMREVMAAVGWGGTAKGEVIAEVMVRNRVIAERFGCLDKAGMADLRRGNAPTIHTGPYAGSQLSADHVIPRLVCPELDTIGERQMALALKFYDAGFLSDEAVLRIYQARVDSVLDSGPSKGQLSCGNHLIPLRVLEAELRKRGVLNP